jgi:hypothetical protein
VPEILNTPLHRSPSPCTLNGKFTFLLSFSGSIGGNQREQDRLKAQKKVANQKKPKESATSLQKRKEG